MNQTAEKQQHEMGEFELCIRCEEASINGEFHAIYIDSPCSESKHDFKSDVKRMLEKSPFRNSGWGLAMIHEYGYGFGVLGLHDRVINDELIENMISYANWKDQEPNADIITDYFGGIDYVDIAREVHDEYHVGFFSYDDCPGELVRDCLEHEFEKQCPDGDIDDDEQCQDFLVDMFDCGRLFGIDIESTGNQEVYLNPDL